MAHHHHHPPSPPGSSRRRLSELLGEQQEPFSLDLHLLEKGCSPAFLDAGAGGACSTCWPRARRGAGGRLLWRRPAESEKRGARASGVLRLLLSKIVLGGKTTAAPPPPAAAKKKRPPQPAAIDWHRAAAAAHDDERQSTPGRFTNAARPSSRPGDAHQRTEDEEEQQEEEEDDEDDTSSSSNSKKQLSPVSVLEQRLFEHEHPPPPHAQKAMAIFRELLEAAYTPTLLDLLANAKAISSNTSKGGGSPSAASTASSPAARRKKKKKKKKTNNRAPSSSPSSDTFDEDLARVAALVASEMPCARVRPEDAREARREIGDAVAAAVLEALAEETAAALLMGMDGPSLCG